MHTLLLNRVFLSYTKLTMLPLLCCLNLKIDYVRLSVISNIFQCTMSNLSLCEHFFHLESIHNLLPLEVVHKCQHCYLCALQETSIGAQAFYVNQGSYNCKVIRFFCGWRQFSVQLERVNAKREICSLNGSHWLSHSNKTIPKNQELKNSLG